MRNLPRGILLPLFLFSSLWETAITVSLFFWPEFEAKQFGSPMTDQTVFFSNIIGGFMILFSGLCFLATYQLYRREPNGSLLANIIGGFWVYMGIGLYFHPGAPTYVLLDTVRGALILLLVFFDRRLDRRLEGKAVSASPARA